jgi:hypothetical protein
MPVLNCFLVLLVLTGTAFSQGTTTLTFDEYPLSEGLLLPVPSGYGGLQWGGFGIINATAINFNHTGYPNGLVSGENLITSFSGASFNGTTEEISSSVPFDFDSAYLTAAFRDGLQIEAQGYTGSTLIYDNFYTINTESPTLILFNFLGVNQVTFFASGGVDAFFQGDGSGFAIDNMTVAVPEPNATGLFFFCVCCGYLISAFLRRNGPPVARLCENCFE